MPEKLILCINYSTGIRREFPEHLVNKTGYLNRFGYCVMPEVEAPPVTDFPKVKIPKAKVAPATIITNKYELLEASGLDDQFEQLPESDNDIDDLNDIPILINL